MRTKKRKQIMVYQVKKNSVWLKGEGEHYQAQFIVLAERTNETSLYAATIESKLSDHFPNNQYTDLESIELVREKGNDEKILQILFIDGKLLTLRDERFCMLIYFPGQEKNTESYVVIVNNPPSIGRGAHYYIFHDDQKDQDAIAFFWIARMMITGVCGYDKP